MADAGEDPLAGLRERDPVNLSPIGTWRLTRYDDVSDVFKRAPTNMTLPDGSNPNFDPLDRRGSFNEFMLNLDGEEHMRLRRLVVKAFTRRARTRSSRASCRKTSVSACATPASRSRITSTHSRPSGVRIWARIS